MSAILVVEDDRFQRETFSGILEKEGHRIIHAASGKDALNLLAELTPDLILLDIIMPGMDGIETCLKIRCLDHLKSVPVVMLTSLDSDSNVIRALDAGADDYITKSSAPEVILNKLKAHLRSKALYDEMDRVRNDQAAIMDVMLKMGSTIEIREVLQILSERVSKQVGGRVSVVLADDKLKYGTVVACSDKVTGEEIEIDLNGYPEIIHAFKTRNVVIVNNVAQNPVVRDVAHILKELNITSLIVIPLLFREEIIGTLFLRGMGTGKTFDEEDIRLCRIMAGAASNAIKNSSLIARIREEREKLKEANKMLEKMHEEKAEFFAMTAHDLTTQLAVIRASSEVLKEGMHGRLNDSQEKLLERSINSCDLIANFVTDMREIARAEYGVLELNIRDNDIPSFIGGIHNMMEPLAAREGMSLKVADGIPEITCLFDAERIARVLENLITNSIKHNDRGCVIVVGGEARNDRCYLFVEDNGRGIPEEQVVRVFDSFLRLKGKRSVPGLGLGLHICKKFVEAHGGEIWAERGRKRGSRFVFYLPVRR